MKITFQTLVYVNPKLYDKDKKFLNNFLHKFDIYFDTLINAIS